MPATRVVIIYGAADGMIRRIVTPDDDGQIAQAVSIAPGEMRIDMPRSLYATCHNHAEVVARLGLNG